MKQQEIYVLNLALGGGPIFGLDRLNGLNMTAVLVDSVKEELIRKGFLKDADHFTDEGILLTKQIKDYKEAVKYIVLAKTIFALTAEGEIIALFDFSNNNYEFGRFKTDGFAEDLMKSYRFMLEYPDSSDGEELSISPEDLEKTFSYGLERINIKTVVDKKEETDDLYFACEHQLYRYDYKRNQLKAMAQADLVNELKVRLSI